MASTISLSPFNTFKTPLGNPASCKSSASFIAHDGSFSEGFKIKVSHKQWQSETSTSVPLRKIKWCYPEQTPFGCRVEKQSMPVPTCSLNSLLANGGCRIQNQRLQCPSAKILQHRQNFSMLCRNEFLLVLLYLIQVTLLFKENLSTFCHKRFVTKSQMLLKQFNCFFRSSELPIGPRR
ncbi:MAG: hypothetical protein Ct9H90mP13_08150 [Pseudomonadota bacterium]|nr:MAG: hypothetical protein Ct9H90mP13_08150 [Pseudomonadota bacterium]